MTNEEAERLQQCEDLLHWLAVLIAPRITVEDLRPLAKADLEAYYARWGSPGYEKEPREPNPMSDHFFFLLGQSAVICEAQTGRKPEDYCQNLATGNVMWSDRSMSVCDQHLDYAKKVAATDGLGDRDENPDVVPVGQPSDLVARYWPEFQKNYYIDFGKDVVKRAPKRRLVVEEDFNEIDCGECNYCNGASDEGFFCDLFNEQLDSPMADMESPFRHKICLLHDEDEDAREASLKAKP